MNNHMVKEQTWVRQILKEYGVVEAQPKLVNSIVEAWPDWVMNLLPILYGVCQPGLKLKRIKIWTAKDLGQFLGLQHAWEGLFWDEVPLSPRVRQEKERWIDSAQKLSSSPELDIVLKAMAN